MAALSSTNALNDVVRRDTELRNKMVNDCKSLTEAELAELPAMLKRDDERKEEKHRQEMAVLRATRLSEQSIDYAELNQRLEAKSRDELMEPIGNPILAHYYGIFRALSVIMKSVFKPVSEGLKKDDSGQLALQAYKTMSSFLDEVIHSVKREDKTMCWRTTKQHLSRYIRDKVNVLDLPMCWLRSNVSVLIW